MKYQLKKCFWGHTCAYLNDVIHFRFFHLPNSIWTLSIWIVSIYFVFFFSSSFTDFLLQKGKNHCNLYLIQTNVCFQTFPIHTFIIWSSQKEFYNFYLFIFSIWQKIFPLKQSFSILHDLKKKKWNLGNK